MLILFLLIASSVWELCFVRDAAAKLPCAPASLNGAYGVRDVCRVFMLNVCSDV